MRKFLRRNEMRPICRRAVLAASALLWAVAARAQETLMVVGAALHPSSYAGMGDEIDRAAWRAF